MESAVLIDRDVSSERPVRVVYSLTSHSIKLLDLLDEMAEWKTRINEDVVTRSTSDYS